MRTPIETLLTACARNDASGHTRHGETLAAAIREHAALVAVAEAAKVVLDAASDEGTVSLENGKRLESALTALAAVRAGGAK